MPDICRGKTKHAEHADQKKSSARTTILLVLPRIQRLLLLFYQEQLMVLIGSRAEPCFTHGWQ